jgi:class 3 adenylate cyclase
MSADVSGYARMMARDDIQTLRALFDCIDRIAGLVDGAGGRIVDAVGDNLLAEFPAPAAAVRCARHVQAMLVERNRSRSPNEQIMFRIGLHSGSLIAHGDRLFGDVVNVAARLQSYAEPGHVLLSEAIASRLEPALERELVERGAHWFKNIPYAVSTFELR